MGRGSSGEQRKIEVGRLILAGHGLGEAMRNAGLADSDVLAVAEVTGYYAFVNRIADGLGVRLEGGELIDIE